MPTAYDRAITAFKQGNSKSALVQINAAAKQFPNSGDVHQLRSLIHFGMKNYKAAAAAAHKALSGDSPWEWNDVKSVYSSTKTYTSDLRALEGYAAKNPGSKPTQFLLAYHYLMLDHKDSARTTLKKVVALEPRDRLAAGLLKAIDQAKN